MRKLWILCLMVSFLAMTSFAQTSKKTTDQKTSTKSADTKSTSAKTDTASAKSDTGKTAPAGKMDINAASKDDLEKLPGIGPATSQKIVDGRPYKTKRDLLTKKIVGQAEYDKIKDNIIAHQTGDTMSAGSTTKATTTKKK
jgi:competence protein ComEA